MGRGISKARGGGITFKSPLGGVSEADNFFQDEYNAWMSKLKTTERSAVKKYTGSAYSSINDGLRKGKKDTQTVKNIDSAIEKYELKEGITVLRGSNSKLLGGANTIEAVNAMAKNGAVLTDKAFLSSATAFGSQFSGSILYEIKVKPGKGKGAYVNPMSQHPSEAEFLIKRNAPLKVKGARKLTDADKNKLGSWKADDYKMIVTLEY